jgi:hypothetical protein
MIIIFPYLGSFFLMPKFVQESRGVDLRYFAIFSS